MLQVTQINSHEWKVSVALAYVSPLSHREVPIVSAIVKSDPSEFVQEFEEPVDEELKWRGRIEFVVSDSAQPILVVIRLTAPSAGATYEEVVKIAMAAAKRLVPPSVEKLRAAVSLWFYIRPLVEEIVKQQLAQSK